MSLKLHEELRSLTKELKEHNYRYYILADPIISDQKFDLMLKRLEYLEAQFPQLKDPNSPTEKVGGGITKKFQTIAHESPMLSLGNTYSKSELVDFDNRIQKMIGHSNYTYVAELKFDGLAISLHYRNGRLDKAITRGDGQVGDDVTKNVQTIKSLNHSLEGDFPSKIEIRGEIFMHKMAFERLNLQREGKGQNTFANPRNCAAGTIKMQDSSEVAQRPLDIFLYHLVSPNASSHWEGLNRISAWGLKTSEYAKRCNDINELMDFVNHWENEKQKLSFDIDGIVIKVNEIEIQKQLGYTSKFPRWAISYKFATDQVTTRLKKITYQVGRTGAVTPVANLEVVNLLGTNVKRASLHNEDFISKMDIRENDVVKIEKGGEIIPKVVGVVVEKRSYQDSPPFHFISKCPACFSTLVKRDGEAIHYCENSSCPPQIKGRIAHFASRNALDIEGLGSETIELLVDKKLLFHFKDLYQLSYDQLFDVSKIIVNPDGTEKKISLKEKSVNNLLMGIEKSKEKPFEKVLFGLGIRYVGETVAKKLAKKFKSWESLSNATREDLEQTEEIGTKIAESVFAYFSNQFNIEVLNDLQNAGLNLVFFEEAKVSRILENQKIVVSGVFSHFSRKDIQQTIENHGGILQGSISSKTNLIVGGENMGPAKLAKAKKLNIKIISEKELINMLDG